MFSSRQINLTGSKTFLVTQLVTQYFKGDEKFLVEYKRSRDRGSEANLTVLRDVVKDDTNGKQPKRFGGIKI